MSGTGTSRRVFKALSIFGSVQIVTILCSVIRTKFIAVWLGPAGIGLFGLYNTAVDVVNQLVQLNLRQSGVREISRAGASMAPVLKGVVRRLGTLLGLLGALLMLLLSPALSAWTFGDTDHSLMFVFLSVVVFLSAVMSGEQALLQASSNFKRLAHASLWGGVSGTLISIILIRFFGYSAIVPSIIAFAVVTAVAYYIPPRHDNSIAKVDFATTLNLGKPILRLGVFMTAAAFTTSLAQYLFLAWMRTECGDNGVGLYQSGYTIVNQYVGLVFTALAVEFFPRISSVSGSNRRTSIFVRHEMSMLLWGLMGCIVLFINLLPVIIPLLYDSTFMPVSSYISIASVGTVFKAVSFVMAFVILARGDGNIYLVTELLSSVLYIIYNIAGYRYGGLTGIGTAYIVWYLSYVIIVFAVYRFRYRLGGIGRQLLLSLLITAIVATQAVLCLYKLYLVATVVTCIAVPLSAAMVYFLFLKRRTLKE